MLNTAVGRGSTVTVAVPVKSEAIDAHDPSINAVTE